MAYYNLNEALKRKEEREKAERANHDEGIHLDDVTRVKVLSPGRQVVKRFVRNRLAIFGLAVLIFMFAFCFLGPLFYPYGQTDLFYEYDTLSVDYALASQSTTYTGYTVDEGVELERNVVSSMNTNIKAMQADPMVLETLGRHVSENYIEGKAKEWDEYRTRVSSWEREKYIINY